MFIDLRLQLRVRVSSVEHDAFSQFQLIHYMTLFFKRHDLVSYLCSDQVQFRLLQSSVCGVAAEHCLEQLVQYVQVRLLIGLNGKEHLPVLHDALWLSICF